MSLATLRSDPFVCSPEEFEAADIDTRRHLVVRQIEAHPELFDMGEWAHRSECGTTFCLAGWACVLAGYQPVYDKPTSVHTDPDSASFFGRGEYHRHDPAVLGASLLGLREEEASYAFYEIEEIDEVKEFLLSP